jgi:hypothetical protein
MLGRGRDGHAHDYPGHFVFALGWGAGPAAQQETVAEILASVTPPSFDPPTAGYTVDFEIPADFGNSTTGTDAEGHTKPNSIPITIDEDGHVVSDRPAKSRRLNTKSPKKKVKATRPPKPPAKPYLACANCANPLYLSEQYRSEADKVYLLRCGHVLDERCLDPLSRPVTMEQESSVIRFPAEGLELLDKRKSKGRGRKGAKLTAAPPSDE